MSDGQAVLVGLLGWPLGHSVSPAMQNAAFAGVGLDWRYVSLPVAPERLGEAVRGLVDQGYRGANVTVPHKEAVLAHVDFLGPEVAAIGAANTLVVQDGRVAAHNTDAAGFTAALAEAGCRPRRAVILGAGGASRAVAFALLGMAAEVTVAGRSVARAQDLAAALVAGHGRVTATGLDCADLRKVLRTADLLVNATPVGMWPHAAADPLPAGCSLGAHLTVMDLVYNPRETMLLRRARAAGARTVDGLGMLVHQGAASFRLWTGLEAPVAIMRAAAVSALMDARSHDEASPGGAGDAESR